MTILRMSRLALSAVCLLAISTTADAELLVNYNFNGGNIASELDPNVLAGTFNAGSGGAFNSGTYAFNESTATSEVEAPFATFAVAALPGSSLSLDRIEFDAAFMGEGGDGMLGVRFVGNGSNAEAAVGGAQFPAFETYSISLAGVSILGDLLKLYVYDPNGGASARIRIDNVRIYGSVSLADVPHAPEPSTLALVGLGVFGFGASQIRKRRRNRAAAV